MASEDVVGKSRGGTAINTIVNLAEEAKLAREGVKGPGHQVLTVCKSLFAGGVAGGLSLMTAKGSCSETTTSCSTLSAQLESLIMRRWDTSIVRVHLTGVTDAD
ncbi:hypothetical protein VPH35_106392 [Triticum aestivum]|uniref:mitochondrial adenine nucleotide transporter ADNT1 n=1 Tax=Triticum aestivum TaxID=4565 RepID=UPI001D034BB3|nr:mitochondrial adenine nucleotide transporter ADNT1-like [Triticum aestivum]